MIWPVVVAIIVAGSLIAVCFVELSLANKSVVKEPVYRVEYYKDDLVKIEERKTFDDGRAVFSDLVNSAEYEKVYMFLVCFMSDGTEKKHLLARFPRYNEEGELIDDEI